jgi:hypothetical protein
MRGIFGYEILSYFVDDFRFFEFTNCKIRVCMYLIVKVEKKGEKGIFGHEWMNPIM